MKKIVKIKGLELFFDKEEEKVIIIWKKTGETKTLDFNDFNEALNIGIGYLEGVYKVYDKEGGEL